MDFQQLNKRALEIRALYSKTEKAKYGREWSMEEIALGLVGDVGDLAKLILAKSGVRETEDVNKKLTHELADCLWSLLVLAHINNIDLEQGFVDAMHRLEQELAE